MENLEQKRRVLKRLREWREKEAVRAGVELFRVLSNDAMNGIAENLPTTKDALLEVKGIAEKKYQTYGRDILAIVSEEMNPGLFDGKKEDDESDEDGPASAESFGEAKEKIFTVGDYLELLNVGLQQFDAKVIGEISSLDIRGNYLFFSIKDKKENAMMSCFMWGTAYKMSGVALEEGMEIQVHGFPELYKPSGRLTFKADTVELVGEGALKKAYDDLKKKLEKEGLFAESRKKPIPEYPQNIGLITSATGAVIHDFLNNIGKFGFKISFRNSRVEGALAVKELVQAVRYFKKSGRKIDVLVVIRGGGSLESLQAFNNETLVREIADCPFPVVVGIGHDKDVPIVSLVADKAGSTPTAVAKLLNFTWDSALSKVRLAEQKIFNRYREALYEKKDALRNCSENIEESFRRIFERFRNVEEKLKRNLVSIGSAIVRMKEKISQEGNILPGKLEDHFKRYKESLRYSEKMLAVNNPMRQLKLGYSLVFAKGKVIRKVEDVESGEEINIRVENGTIITKVLST
ncbi:MAG: exodeoxyribonuclease VII large subunit [Candidatus Parcubacteria bacterium]|nr:exodeoxyribonuclease VII large subunit [Candidatus Parcubacteria bacterium]